MRKIIIHEKYFSVCVLSLYLLLGFIGIHHHEMWRDEVEAWLVARDNSPPQIINHLRTVAHPALWYLILKIIQQVSLNPFIMQVVHLLIGGSVVYVLVRYAPFSRVQKVLLAFSYFIFYEYGIISRNYSLAVLFIFIICALCGKPKKNYYLIGLCIFLLCNSNTLGIVIAGGLVLYLVAEYYQRTRLDEDINATRIFVVSGILVIGLVIIYLYASPFSLQAFWRSLIDLRLNTAVFLKTLKSIWNSYFPVPPLSLHFWNNNFLTFGPAQNVLSLLLGIIMFILFLRKPLILFYYIVTTLALLFFYYQFFQGYLRHHGFLFIVLVSSYWLYLASTQNMPAEQASFSSRKLLDKWMTLVFAVHFAAAIIASTYEVIYPFSASEQTCDYIIKNRLQDNVIVGDPDYVVQSCTAWLDKKIYYPIIDDYGTYVVWNDPRRKSIDQRNKVEYNEYKQYVVQQAIKIARTRRQDIVLFLNYPINLPLLKSFRTTIERTEKYYVYRISPHM